MNKFKDVKPGDIVMFPIRVRKLSSYYYTYKEFFVPKKVTRETKTQLMVEVAGKEVKFKRETGFIISSDNKGSSGYVLLNTETPSQTKELELYLDRERSMTLMTGRIHQAYQYVNHLSLEDVPIELADKIASLLLELESYRSR